MITEATGILAFAGVLHLGARTAIVRGFHAPRPAHHITPAELGLPASEVAIASANGKRLFARLIPANSAAPVLLVHGRDDETAPFDDAESLLAIGLKAGRQVQLPPLEGGHEVSDALRQHENSVIDFLAASFSARPPSQGSIPKPSHVV